MSATCFLGQGGGDGGLVVGDADVENGTVGVNARGLDDPDRDVALDDFCTRLATEVADHA